jgi:hypothetical protein
LLRRHLEPDWITFFVGYPVEVVQSPELVTQKRDVFWLHGYPLAKSSIKSDNDSTATPDFTCSRKA